MAKICIETLKKPHMRWVGSLSREKHLRRIRHLKLPPFALWWMLSRYFCGFIFSFWTVYFLWFSFCGSIVSEMGQEVMCARVASGSEVSGQEGALDWICADGGRAHDVILLLAAQKYKEQTVCISRHISTLFCFVWLDYFELILGLLAFSTTWSWIQYHVVFIIVQSWIFRVEAGHDWNVVVMQMKCVLLFD